MSISCLGNRCLFQLESKSIPLEVSQDLPQHERLLIRKQELDAIPDAPGVYTFVGSQQEPLYIGKSVHMRQRLKSHVFAAKDDDRVARYVLQAQTLEWHETAGDLHAQLLENREIKSRFPLFNRAQRRVKRLFTWQFCSKRPSHLILVTVQSDALQHRTQVCYGLFKSAKHAKEALTVIADRDGLCLALLGFEKSQGACFRSQINKCAGACAGRESFDDMFERLFESLLPLSFQLWPYPGIVQFQENGHWHALYQWQSLGLFPQKLTAKEQKALLVQTPLFFDKDEYHIIKRALL